MFHPESIQNLRFLLALIPGGVVLTLPSHSDNDTEDEFRVIRHDALRSYLATPSAAAPFLPDVNITDIPPVLLRTLVPPTFDILLPEESLYNSYATHQMVVHESPLTAGTYRVWVYAFKSYASSSPHAFEPDLLYKFTLSFHGTEIHWREPSPPVRKAHELTGEVDRQGGMVCGGIAYSGHAHTNRELSYAQALILAPVSGVQGGMVDLVDAGECRMTPYSGALAFATSQGIFIQYFR